MNPVRALLLDVLAPLMVNGVLARELTGRVTIRAFAPVPWFVTVIVIKVVTT
jgi:hypothetical protein